MLFFICRMRWKMKTAGRRHSSSEKERWGLRRVAAKIGDVDVFLRHAHRVEEKNRFEISISIKDADHNDLNAYYSLWSSVSTGLTGFEAGPLLMNYKEESIFNVL